MPRLSPIDVQDLLDLIERLAPEVLGLEHFGLGLADQLANGADVGVLQAVVRPHRQLELLDALVEVLVGDAGARRLRARIDRFVVRVVEADEDVQVIANQLRRQRHRVARRHRAVGPDFDGQLVVVGGLADARALDLVVDLLDRRVHRVDRDPADAEILVEVAIGGDVAAAALDAQLHVQLAALGDGRDVRIRFQDFDVGVGFDVRGAHRARLVLPQRQRLGVVDVARQRQLLEVEDDVGRVLDHALDRRELVQHAVDLHGGDRRAFDRRQQHAAQRVADGRAEAALERLRVEAAEPIGQGLAFELKALGALKTFPHISNFLSLTGRQTGLQTCGC